MIGGLSKWVFIFDPLFATPEELRRLKSSLELSIAHSICSNELTVKRWSRLMMEHYRGAKNYQIVFCESRVKIFEAKLVQLFAPS